jgi:TolB-like protein
MPLAAGTRLGPYVILAPLGAGGMGEVYRAEDPRLQRAVAIKVLPAATATDPEALSRFQREARAIAALAHPNLLALYDVGSESGFAYAVTELLEGMTLRARLASGPLPVEEVRDTARQIARGLAAAHDKGIIHRDLKPENVFLTADGHVKLLDFGLAKLAPPPGTDRSTAETMTSVTMPGTVMGTLGYMPPEQLLGQPVDPRSDGFAFGAVLYEMLTGARAFAGPSEAAVVAAILAQDPPPVPDSDRTSSRALEAIARRCMQKNPEDRFTNLHAVLEALDQAEATPSGSGPGSARSHRRGTGWGIAGAAAFVILLGLGAAYGVSRFRAQSSHASVRPRAIAMLDFENLTGDPTLDWIGRGLPELLGTALARSPELDVYDPQRLMNLLAGSGHARDTLAPVFERLRDRGVGRAIVGSILRSGSNLRIQCRVVDVESGRVVHADVSEGAGSDDLFQLAGRLIPQLQTWLEIDLTQSATGDQWLREITTSSSDAYRLYLRGHTAMMASRWRESAGYDEQSLALDSTFVAARFDLTGCYWNLGDEVRTRESLAAARRLRSRASPREGLQLEMIDAVISENSAQLIRTASALRELYPENRFFKYLLGRGYFTAGRWNECITVLAPLVRERWTWAWTYVLTGRSYEKLGRLDDARRALGIGMEVTHRNPEVALVLALLLGRTGERAAARDLLLQASRSPELAETPDVESQIRLELGKIYQSQGQLDSARTEYERSIAVLPAGSGDTADARARLSAISRAR